MPGQHRGRDDIPLPVPPDVRAQIRQAVETEVAPLKGAGEVERYLGDLEARARRNRRVTALEVEPGVEAIQRLAGEIGPERTQEKLATFTQTMARLSAELDGRDRPAPPTDFNDLARRIEAARGDERNALIRRYDEATRGLPPEEQQREIERLNRLAAAR
jgi:hypothetical protein